MAQANKHIVEEMPRKDNGIGGRIEMSEDVVATIAGLAARDIKGIYSLGKSRIVPFGDNPKRGVDAEVGMKEAALDLEVVIEHGCDLRKVANELRTKVANEVDKMAGRKVVEVNLDVVGVHLAEQEAASQQAQTEERPRVV